MMTKKITGAFTILLTSFSILSLAGCGSEGAKSSQTQSQVTAPSKRQTSSAYTADKDKAGSSKKSSDESKASADRDKDESATSSGSKTSDKSKPKANSAPEKVVATKHSTSAEVSSKAGDTATNQPRVSASKAGSANSAGHATTSVKTTAPKQNPVVSSSVKTSPAVSSTSDHIASVAKSAASSSSTAANTKSIAPPTPVHATERVGSGGLFKTFEAARTAEVAAVMASNTYDAGHVFSVYMNDGSMEWSWEPTTLGD